MFVLGCSSPALDARSDLRPPSVAGYWYIDQPMHALYEATVYRFDTDGPVAALAAFPEGYRTGTVGTVDGSITCEFAGSWASDGGQWMELGLSCSDGHHREVLLKFEQGISGCTGDQGCLPQVHSVDGDTENWTRNWPEWMWLRCTGENDCMDRLRLWTGR
ncbi:MAG: hypothetical protein CVU59_02530 [Deltaproteobacteria bacterium HGW-Deltaproteobacteria-17]|nr:MAG: hypothetical protein CVU59_02530 [Deltaproteobacteria bacterium HGW-Deltaproteobacteria-17]